MSQVVSVISGKGGTGKTSLCAGISSCLAAEGSQVLCIDADVGLRNLDLSLGMSEEPILPFTAVMRGEYSLDSAAAHPEIPNLYMLTAPVTETAEELDAAQFSAMLDAARQRFDWILIDAPAGIGAGFRLATGSADQAIVVAGSDPASLRDAARATDVLLQQRSIPARLVVNRVSAALYRRMHATIDDVMDTTGTPLAGVVPEDPNITLSAAFGSPVPVYAKRCAAARAFRRIAARLEGIPTKIKL